MEKKKMKFTIDMLDTAARLELIENNYTLSGMVYDDMAENEMSYIDEQLQYIKPGLKEWSICPASYNYITVDDALLFLDGLEKLQQYYCTLPDTMTTEINTVLAARDRFRNMDMNYSNLYQLSKWLDRKAQYFADCMAQYFERCLDFSHNDMVSYFLEFYADERMYNSFYVENGKLYQTITREVR
jgi:hypothetical protein